MAAGVALLLAGCTASPVSEPLGSITYLIDKQPSSPARTWVYTAPDLPGLAALAASAGDPDLARTLAAVDADRHVVVSLYFDACAKADPSLVLEGSVVSVRYGTTRNRACARAVDTLAVFAVARDRLPETWRLEVCNQALTVSAGTVSGKPIGLC